MRLAAAATDDASATGKALEAHACMSPSQAGLAGMLGMAGSANVQGEDQKKLDVLANDVFISLLTVRRLPRGTCLDCRRFLAGRVYRGCCTHLPLLACRQD